MKIWIIYDAERYQKNAVFAKKLKEAFKKRKQMAEIIIFDDFSTLPFPLPDIAIMRMVHPLLTEFLIENGVYVQNNAFVSQITNDKYKTYYFLSPFVYMAKSYLIDDSCLDFPLPFPFILKSLDGHGGQEVFYVQNKNEVHQAFLQTNKKQKPIFNILKKKNFQPKISYPTKLNFINKKKIKSFTNKQILKNFITTKPTLQKLLKKTLNIKKNNQYQPLQKHTKL